MKQSQINKAYAALSKIAHATLPVRESYALYRLMKLLEPAYRFEVEHERKLMEKYGCHVSGDGNVVVSDQERAEDFRREFNELLNLDVDVDIAPVAIEVASMEGVKMTALDMMSLDGFVEFV